MKKNKLFLFGIFLIFHVVALGQREIKGTIISEDDNLGIPGAKVKIKGTVVGTVSDLDGTYSITITSDSDRRSFKEQSKNDRRSSRNSFGYQKK